MKKIQNKPRILYSKNFYSDIGADKIDCNCEGYIDVGDRCWRRNVLVTITYRYKMLVTVFAILVLNINYPFTLASGTNFKSPT